MPPVLPEASSSPAPLPPPLLSVVQEFDRKKKNEMLNVAQSVSAHELSPAWSRLVCPAPFWPFACLPALKRISLPMQCRRIYAHRAALAQRAMKA